MSEVEEKIDKIKDELEEIKGLVTNTTPQPPTVKKFSGDLFTAIGAVAISMIVIVYFGGMLYITATQEFPPSQRDNVSGLLWTLNTLVVSVVSYWVGSSAGSVRKTTAMMENIRK